MQTRNRNRSLGVAKQGLIFCGLKFAAAVFGAAAVLPGPAMASTFAVSDYSSGVCTSRVEMVSGGTKLLVTALYTFTNTAEAASITFSSPATIDVLVVGGGGAGARSGGGGGGGQVIEQMGIHVEAGTYPIVVGEGGIVGGESGGTSSVFSISAAGGRCATGKDGGASGNGKAGGTGHNTSSGDNRAGGGGGGSGGSGDAGGSNVPGGKGGDGVVSSITGEYYGGGGGGGESTKNSYDPGEGGKGGGGRGGDCTSNNSVAGTPGTGGGGGGGGGRGGATLGLPAAGGSGIVIIRHAAEPPSSFRMIFR